MKKLLDLKSCDCRWPLGPEHEKAEFFCAEPKAPGSQSYCAAHARKAHVGTPHWRIRANEAHAVLIADNELMTPRGTGYGDFREEGRALHLGAPDDGLLVTRPGIAE